MQKLSRSKALARARQLFGVSAFTRDTRSAVSVPSLRFGPHRVERYQICHRRYGPVTIAGSGVNWAEAVASAERNDSSLLVRT